MIGAIFAATLMGAVLQAVPEQPTDGVRTRYAAGSCAYGYYPFDARPRAVIVLTPNEIVLMDGDKIDARSPYNLSADDTISFGDGPARFELTCIIGGPAQFQEYVGDKHASYSLYWHDPAEFEGKRR